jgi:hypothetical protein
MCGVHFKARDDPGALIAPPGRAMALTLFLLRGKRAVLA